MNMKWEKIYNERKITSNKFKQRIINAFHLFEVIIYISVYVHSEVDHIFKDVENEA